MNRRSFLQGSIAALGGSLFVGKERIEQAVPTGNVKTEVEIDSYGNFIFPGFFTVFIDGKEAFRMAIGEEITADRTCHVVAFNGFESTPSINMYMMPGDTLAVHN